MKKIICSTVCLMVLVCSSTAFGFMNTITRNFGGTSTIELNKDERLVNVTWKEDNLWVLTKKDPDTKPSTYMFKEHSNFGIAEGQVIIIEK